jgi:hypothetical protein
VLLASGKAVPISSLRPGQQVVSTSTKTGKNQTGTIAAVLVHHDTNRYDLTIRAHGRTAVIHTTSNHPFWDVTTHRWVKAGALRYGTDLRTPDGGTATVLGGHSPRDRYGWMWDLTVPGDHDFYIDTTAADILVHNCSPPLRRYQGGVYTLRDDEADEAVVRTGMSNDLYERQLAHARLPATSQYRFQVEYLTNDVEEQKGLEQMLYDKYPEARVANGGLDKYSPIDLANSNYQRYMQAARNYLARQADG